MQKYPYSEQLLKHNSQFSDNQRLNHEAISLLLKHNLKERNLQTFVLAGSEDLRALLPYLELSQNGQEAYIIIRPYIHSMALYIKNHNNKLYAFLFDSQNWSVRYYPTRNIIHALQTQIPEITIILSGTEIQSQDIQIGCFYYSLEVLNYCELNSVTFFDQLLALKMSPMSSYAGVYELGKKALPKELFTQLSKEHFVKNAQEVYLGELELILVTHYRTEGNLNWTLIQERVEELQGYNLLESDQRITAPQLYKVTIDAFKRQLTISFENKDLLLYGNVLLFSSALYPIQVRLDKCTVLGAAKGIEVKIDAEAHSVTYSASSLSLVAAAFSKLIEDRASLFSLHMRQQLALRELCHSVQEEIELSKIKSEEGGLDQRQVQMALAHVFREHPDVYVPTYYDLAGKQAKIDLEALKKKEYQFVGFTLDDGNGKTVSRHQVAVWVNLTTLPYQVFVYDSEGGEKTYEERLSTIFDKGLCAYHVGKSPYVLQRNNWSCGVYVVKHLLAAYSTVTAGAKQSVNTELLAREYYRAYKIQEGRETQLHAEAERNDQYKRALLELTQKIETYNPRLKELTTLLRIELWGNSSCSGTGTENESDEYRRTRPIAALLADYCKQEVTDKKNVEFLRLAVILQYLKIEQSMARLESFEKFQRIELDSRDPDNKLFLELALSIYADSIRTKNVKSNKNIRIQKEFLCEAIAILMSAHHPKRSLYTFLQYIDCDYYWNNKNYIRVKDDEFEYVNSELLKKLIASFFELENNLESELKQSKQYKVSPEEKQKLREMRVVRLKRILTDANVPVLEECLYDALSAHHFARPFIERYVNELYFQDITPIERVTFIGCLLGKNNYDCDLKTALSFYPGKHLLKYIDHSHRPKSINELISLIKTVPSRITDELLSWYPYAPKDFNDFRKLLDSFKTDDEDEDTFRITRANSRKQLPIVLKFSYLITTSAELISILSSLSVSHHLQLITHKSAVITTCVELIDLISEVNYGLHEPIFSLLCHLVTSIDDLIHLLYNVEDQHRVAVGLICRHAITCSDDLNKLLIAYPVFTSTDPCLFTNLKISCFEDLEATLTLSWANKSKLLIQHDRHLRNFDQVLHVLTLLNPEDTAIYLREKGMLPTFRDCYHFMTMEFDQLAPNMPRLISMVGSVLLSPQMKSFLLFVCDIRQSALKGFIDKHAEAFFKLIADGILASQHLAEIPKMSFKKEILDNLEHIILSPNVNSLRNLLATGISLSDLLSCKDKAVLDIFLCEAEFIKQKYSGNRVVHLKTVLSRTLGQLTVMMPFAGYSFISLLHEYTHSLSQAHVEFFYACFLRNPSFMVWQKSIFADLEQVKLLIDDCVLLPEHFECLDGFISLPKMRNLEHMFSRSSQSNSWLRNLFLAGFSFKSLFETLNPLKVSYLLIHSNTILKCIQLFPSLKDRVNNLLNVHPEVLTDALTVVNLLVSRCVTPALSPFATIISRIFSTAYEHEAREDYFIQLLKNEPKVTRIAFLEVLNKTLVHLDNAKMQAAFPNADNENACSITASLPHPVSSLSPQLISSAVSAVKDKVSTSSEQVTVASKVYAKMKSLGAISDGGGCANQPEPSSSSSQKLR